MPNSIFITNIQKLKLSSFPCPGSNIGVSPDHWLPPPPGWIKLNFDGAFNSQTGHASIGGLARDSYGKLLMAFTCEVRAAHPLEAELLALQRALQHVSPLLPSALQIEGGCLVLVTSIQNSSHLSWDLMPMWRRTMDMLTSCAQWTIHYCKRSANCVADMLASYEIPFTSAHTAGLPLHIIRQVELEQERAAAFTNSFFYLPQEAGDEPSFSLMQIPEHHRAIVPTAEESRGTSTSSPS
eukprot:TRINITY_DN17581_c0_g1_i5.p1 TRINITY_DN17581_c0_g1~~TRINITY_DN17581_c0_g1_i5.p1  ORF type:complete len:239 (+),score=28.11 TRINITY_DN17581_c0_g1_i5:144-860(+)